MLEKCAGALSLFLGWLFFLGFVFATPVIAQTKGSPGAVLPTSQDVKSCINSRSSAECLDNLFAEALKRHSTLEILHLLQRYEAEDPELATRLSSGRSRRRARDLSR